MIGKKKQEFRTVLGDLHVHTCLSPCATLDMTPMKIVRQACKKGLKLIAITDHNSAENAAAVMAAAEGFQLSVIPGMEITTAEEAHIVALFAGVGEALSMQELVYENLLSGENDDALFGIQVIANELDEVEGINRRLLIGATALGLTDVVRAVHERGGLAVAAHIDRASFSVVSQLGFIPQGLELDAIEISRRMPLDTARVFYKDYEQYAFITASDAHDLADLGVSPMRFRVLGAEWNEIRLAFANREGRRIIPVSDV